MTTDIHKLQKMSYDSMLSEGGVGVIATVAKDLTQVLMSHYSK